MIDLKWLRDNPETARASQRARRADESLVDRVIAADEERRAALATFENARAEQKEVSRSIGKSAPEEREAVMAQAKTLAEKVKELEVASGAAAAQLDALALELPNIVLDGVPEGGEENFEVLRHVGTPRDFASEGFTPLDHLDLGEKLKAIDVRRGTKISGARFYYMTGIGARLELALLNAAMDQAVSYGFIPMMTPTLVNPATMSGTGFLGEQIGRAHV